MINEGPSVSQRRSTCQGPVRTPQMPVRNCASHTAKAGGIARKVPTDADHVVPCTCRDVIRAGLGGMAAGSGSSVPGCEDAAEAAAVPEPVVHREVVMDYGSDSDLPLLHSNSLARRRSLIHLRESRRRDSINTMCAHGFPPTSEFVAVASWLLKCHMCTEQHSLLFPCVLY